MDVRVPIENLGHEAESFPERDTVDAGIEGHHPNASECPFEEILGKCATDTGPTESPSDVEAPHTKRVRDNGLDRDATDSSQNVVRVRGEQCFTVPIKTYRAGRPIGREPIEKRTTFGAGLRPYGVEISRQFVDDGSSRTCATRLSDLFCHSNTRWRSNRYCSGDVSDSASSRVLGRLSYSIGVSNWLIVKSQCRAPIWL